MAYNASSIRVLRDDEIVEKFEWAKVGALASQYEMPRSFVARLIESAELVGWPVELAVQRYLAGNRSVVPPPEMNDVHRDLCLRSDRGFSYRNVNAE